MRTIKYITMSAVLATTLSGCETFMDAWDPYGAAPTYSLSSTADNSERDSFSNCITKARASAKSDAGFATLLIGAASLAGASEYANALRITEVAIDAYDDMTFEDRKFMNHCMMVAGY